MTVVKTAAAPATLMGRTAGWALHPALPLEPADLVIETESDA
jgi:hypothetical protein